MEEGESPSPGSLGNHLNKTKISIRSFEVREEMT